MIYFYNTLTKRKQVFKSIKDKQVDLYTCGPTVYSTAHIGNLRTYIFGDILKRVLLYQGYKVKHVMNITDVGHLTSDADTGEDKVEKAAKKSKKSAFEIAEFYTKSFFTDCKKLNILAPDIIAKATDHIKEDIELIKSLEKNNFTYQTSDGIYFDTSKLKDYGKLTGMNFKKLNKTLKAGARIELSLEKKNITDFSLWKFSPKNSKRQMEWESPWGRGFPGWHIECSVINLKYLGKAFKGKRFLPKKAQTIDIHTGGTDLIPIHHTNEIAQVEAITNKRFVNFWLHGEFLILKDARMGKSESNAILIKNIEESGFSPLSFRYLVLNSHYRTSLEFSQKALENAQESLNNIHNFILDCLIDNKKIQKKKTSTFSLNEIKKEFEKSINDDLNTPRALAAFWKLIKDYYQIRNNPKKVYEIALSFDKVLGLGLDKIKLVIPPKKIKELAKKREQLRKMRKWAEADKIRKIIEKSGFLLEDTKKGTIIKPKL
ncbi:MAG: cysteine--tRNA ligase [Candidatus Pacebacteria bacterium]|nr:cysteine--tRNA ligase [Candidatus Paceibacterota bacterium]